MVRLLRNRFAGSSRASGAARRRLLLATTSKTPVWVLGRDCPGGGTLAAMSPATGKTAAAN